MSRFSRPEVIVIRSRGKARMYCCAVAIIVIQLFTQPRRRQYVRRLCRSEQLGDLVQGGGKSQRLPLRTTGTLSAPSARSYRCRWDRRDVDGRELHLSGTKKLFRSQTAASTRLRVEFDLFLHVHTSAITKVWRRFVFPTVDRACRVGRRQGD